MINGVIDWDFINSVKEHADIAVGFFALGFWFGMFIHDRIVSYFRRERALKSGIIQ